MIATKVIIKMKMILLHLDNHKNASKILLIYKMLNNIFVFHKYKNNIVALLTLGKSLVWTLIFNFNKASLGETACLSNPCFLLTGCLGIQFLIHPLSQHSQLGYLWLPTPHCAALV